MFQPWRIKMQQAEQAYRGGQLDEAQRMLQQDQLKEFKTGRQLSVKVADSLVARAKQRVSLGDTSAGWHDLNTANQLTGETQSMINLRSAMIKGAIDEAEKLLNSDNPEASLQRLDRLQQRNIQTAEIRTLVEVSRRMQHAQAMCNRGQFDKAENELINAAILRPDLAILEDRRRACRAMYEARQHQIRTIQRALQRRNWHQVIQVSNQMLQAAPNDQIAQDARKQAWIALAPTRETTIPLKASLYGSMSTKQVSKKTNLHQRSPRVDTVVNFKPKDKTDQRFLLWVDAVGGFLICLSDEIILGQPIPGGAADVPILADLSSQHAVIRREGENYSLVPFQSVQVNGQRVNNATVLTNSCVIELGDGVKMKFTKPHPLSTTARLDIISRHRTQPGADAIILMSNSCVLGPTAHNHLVCSDWPADAVLFRQDDKLFFRHNEAYQIDGKEHKGRGPLTLSSCISSEDFSLSLEPVGV